MANTRELSQLASLINIIDQSKSIGVVTEYPDAKVGIGTLVPTSKVDVVGDVNVSGAITATSFYGDGSNLLGIIAGVGPEDSINTTGIITASSFSGDGSNLTGISSDAFTLNGQQSSYYLDYNNFTNIPSVPSDTSDLTNNAGFVTSSIIVGYATEGYVSQQISSLIGGAPETLDTLNELAAALNDDENFATTITNSLVGLASEGYVNNLVAISTFSGNYNDLTNKPTIPSIVGLASEGYVDSAVSGVSTFSGDYNDLINKPAIPSIVGLASEGYVNNLVAISTFSGDYNDLTNKPEIPQSGVDFDPVGTDNSTDVSLSGSYDYLTISNQQITLNQIDASTDILGLSNVATSGSYTDLSNTPSIPSDTEDLTNSVGFVTSSIVVGYATEGYVNNLVAISTFSRNYNDLTNKPSIPSIVGLASEGYVNVAVANLVDSAPSTLDTLNELAAALGDDANFSTTITNSLANKADLSGANFTGVITATTFYGDGSNLSNIISGVGINSNGVIVGTGITTLNFLGTGTTISISGDIANISVSSSSVETSPGKLSSSFTATGGQTSFSVSYSVGYIDVYLNGIRLSSDEFTASDGSSVILNTGVSSGDVLDVIEYTMGKGDTGDPGPSGPLEVETTSNNDTYNPVFALGTGTTTAFTNSNLSYNPSTGALTASAFFGDGSNLTGVSAGSTVADDTSTNETFYPILTQTTTGTVTSTKVSTTNLSFNPFTGNLSAVDFNSTSDKNLKENIRLIDNPIEKVIQISGVTFDWKSSKHSSAGVIAQEVEKILPQIVNETDGNKSVNYNGLIGLLVEVVKQQQEQINTLSNRIETLEESI